jgi:hypothetical protein
VVIFTIGYTSVEYGKVKIGKLIIQTAEYYWCFVLKGTFPKYVPPKNIQGQIDNRLDAKTTQAPAKPANKPKEPPKNSSKLDVKSKLGGVHK